ncbi:MAG: RidA family protein [Actinomycetota bacterium]|nr:RidA family protein [Actinomycetota bacterium]
MARTLSNPTGLHPAPGFSHVAISRGSTMVHFAGQIALDENFGIIGGADLFEQTQAAMRNLETAMNEAGVDWQHIVRRTIYTTQPTQYEVITSAIHSVTGGADDPPQTIVGITGLAINGLLIEIECTAVLD